MKYQPSHFLIGLASPDNFITPYRWANDDQGNVCPVLHCQFDRPGTGPTDVYAKVIDLTARQGVVMCLNEISGWLLARAGRLPVADTAFLASIRSSELPSFKHGDLPPEQPGGLRLFFCTQEISRTQATGLVSTEALITEQAHWPHVHGAIALDEYTGNPDRHAHNMVRKAHQDFALIDHGRLLYRNAEPCWHADELEGLLDHGFVNAIHHNMYVHGNISASAARTNGFKQCSDSALHQAQNMRSVFFEIAYWCAKLSPGTSAQWLHFLNERMHRVDALLSKRFGILNLTSPHAFAAATP